MENYNFAADLLATFRAAPDFIKALCLLVPPCFAFAVLKLLMSGRRTDRTRASSIDEDVITAATAHLYLEPLPLSHLSASKLARVMEKSLPDRSD